MFELKGYGAYAPPDEITTAEIAGRYGDDAASHADRTGVRRRFYAGGMSQVEMGLAAARAALEDAGLEPGAVDLLIAAAAVPYQAIPGTASVYARHLGLADGGVATMDVNTTCLSFVSALDLAATYIAAGHARCVLIVTSEMASRGLPWHDDPETAAIFGDGAAAVVVTPGDSRIAARSFQTYGSAWEACQLEAGGTRFDHLAEDFEMSGHAYFRMNGKELFKLTASHFPGFVDGLIAAAGWQRDQITRVIPHQASPLGLRHVMKVCKFAPEAFVDMVSEFGNMIAASIPFVMARERAAGRIAAGDKVLLLGTSAGVSFGGLALEIAR